MASHYLWLKAVHIAFMVTWFAGLFYLPRLFIYHLQSEQSESRRRFEVMERRLFAIMTIGGVLTVVAGLALIWISPSIAKSHWFMLKLILVAGLWLFHYRCWVWIVRLRHSRVTEDSKWLRWFNEIPVLFLFAIIILAVVKPF
jgi:putative membrane protein